MTAFTYRFAPAMKYLRHLLKSGALGTPRHFRSQRFLDWPETSWGWRQYKSRAGAGDLFDTGKSGVLQPIMPLDLPVKVRPWELTVYPRSHIRR